MPSVALRPFFTWGEGGEKNIKLLSLFFWACGGSVLVYNWIDGVIWTSIYPNPNNLSLAVWLMHLAVRLLSSWMPMALFLVHWRIRNKIIFIIYLVGVALAPLLALGSVGLILSYTNDNYLREQYLQMAKEEIKAGVFPGHMIRSAEMFGCCSWHTPLDLVEDEGFKPEVGNNIASYDFVVGMSKCYGNIFEVKKGEGNSLVYTTTISDPKTANSSMTPVVGCKKIYTVIAVRIANYISSMAIVIGIASPIFIVLYVLSYKEFAKRALVVPYEPLEAISQETPARSDNVFSEDNLEQQKSDNIE